jgi:hypothetical protein
MGSAAPQGDDGHMDTADSLTTRASELLEDARRFRAAAAEPSCHAEAPDALNSLEEALQVLSAAWYQLAADASPGLVERRSREQEVRLKGALHDVAAAFARCARACREGRSQVTPIWVPNGRRIGPDTHGLHARVAAPSEA